MVQVTWRADDRLVERVRRQAKRNGRSLNEHLTRVLDAATNPDLATDEAARLRERLAAAGVLANPAGQPRKRPDRHLIAEARAADGRGTPLSEIVSQDRG
jgi:hypothetical protein